jgi:hypothetical protein
MGNYEDIRQNILDDNFKNEKKIHKNKARKMIATRDPRSKTKFPHESQSLSLKLKANEIFSSNSDPKKSQFYFDLPK